MNDLSDWEDTQSVDHYLQPEHRYQDGPEQRPPLTYEQERDMLAWWGIHLPERD